MNFFKLFTLILLIGIFTDQVCGASKFNMKGYSRKPDMESYEIKAHVVRYVEFEKFFNVSLSKQNAFYELPKTSKGDVKKFLEDATSTKKVYTWVVNPYNREIFEVRDQATNSLFSLQVRMHSSRLEAVFNTHKWQQKFLYDFKK